MEEETLGTKGQCQAQLIFTFHFCCLCNQLFFALLFCSRNIPVYISYWGESRLHCTSNSSYKTLSEFVQSSVSVKLGQKVVQEQEPAHVAQSQWLA